MSNLYLVSQARPNHFHFQYHHVIGESLSEPHTSGTAWRMWEHTVNRYYEVGDFICLIV